MRTFKAECSGTATGVQLYIGDDLAEAIGDAPLFWNARPGFAVMAYSKHDLANRARGSRVKAYNSGNGDFPKRITFQGEEVGGGWRKQPVEITHDGHTFQVTAPPGVRLDGSIPPAASIHREPAPPREDADPSTRANALAVDEQGEFKITATPAELIASGWVGVGPAPILRAETFDDRYTVCLEIGGKRMCFRVPIGELFDAATAWTAAGYKEA